MVVAAPAQPEGQIEEEHAENAIDINNRSNGPGEAAWEDIDISGNTSERGSRDWPDQSDLKFENSFEPNEGMRLSVSRSVFNRAKRSKGKPTLFKEESD